MKAIIIATIRHNANFHTPLKNIKEIIEKLHFKKHSDEIESYRKSLYHTMQLISLYNEKRSEEISPISENIFAKWIVPV